MTKFLTARDFLRAHACDAITPGPALTEAQRYEQVCAAKCLRNFWFTSTLGSVIKGPDFLSLNMNIAQSTTPSFGEPVIVTDMISLSEPPLRSQNAPFQLVTIKQIGGEGNAYGRDFFNTDLPLISWLTLKHERNHSQLIAGITTVNELMDKCFAFTPHLLRPYEMLQCVYNISGAAAGGTFMPHCGFRGIRILSPDSPYAQLSALADKQVRNYIKGAEPETFLMEVRTTIASLGALGSGVVDLRTPQQDRPLLILGAASNVEGVQMRMQEETSYYQFTYQEKPNAQNFSLAQFYADPPSQLIAANTDYRNVSLFNMWPVPHVLEPGAQLRIRLSNGLFPETFNGGALKQAAATRSSQDVRLTFLCRTP